MPQSPLAGTRVLDLSRLLPGPFCSMVLADLGAEVIKVESPRLGDPMRVGPPQTGGESCYFLSINRSKKSLALNLRRPEGRRIFLRLVPTADVVIESYRPGQAAQIGVGYEALAKVNPRLVYCSVTGFGQDGPLRDRPGHDLSYAALAGLLDLMRPPEMSPYVPPVPLADMSSALFAAVGILAALAARGQHGDGAHVDTSIFHSALAWTMFPGSSQMVPSVPNERGQRYVLGEHPGYHLYPTKDGRYMALTALEPMLWTDFCEAIDRRDLVGRRVSEAGQRQAVISELEGIFRQRDQAEWIRLFDANPASCEPVRTLEEALGSSEVRRDSLVELEHPTAGRLLQVRMPYGAESGRHHQASPPPLLGQHTEVILRSLGYDKGSIARLRAKGIVSTSEDSSRRKARRAR